MLADDVVVFRSVKRWDQLVSDVQPDSSAFLRRPSDSSGMSVDYNVKCPEECARSLTNKKAVLKLSVGAIRGLGYSLDVIATSSTHANIDTGVPIYEQTDSLEGRRLAESIAADLASIAAVEWVKPRPPT